MAELEQLVRSLVAEACGANPGTIERNADLREYGMDSVRAVDLLVRLEEAFAISIPDEALPGLRTLSQIVAHVARERSEEHEDAENAGRAATNLGTA